jgi:hypothetical protein
MQTADFNHNDFKDTAEADKSLLVRFFYKNIENKLESRAAGRPIFKEKIYIEIRLAGQRGVQACRPVTYADKMRFPLHLKAFEDRVQPPTEGTPLIEWTQISRTQAEELAFLHVKTVEQLAGVKDTNIQNFMGGYALRDKAAKWLSVNEAEVDTREKQEMQADIDGLKAQVAELLGGIKNAASANDTSPAVEESNLQSVLDSAEPENIVETPVEDGLSIENEAPVPKRTTRKRR